METKKILITGGTGSFGNALIDYLDNGSCPPFIDLKEKM